MPKKLDYEQVIESHLSVLRDLQAPSGLFRASPTDSTGYDKAWLRDNFYECLPFMMLHHWDVVEKTYTALLNVMLKHEEKIDEAIRQKPDAKYKYIHARFHPETFAEFWEEWGNKQNDSVGAMLFTIGELEFKYKRHLLKTDDQRRIVQKLVDYLGSLKYWEDPDSGVWEESEEVHASSVGACVAGLKSISRLDYIQIPTGLIENGESTLRNLLPRESKEKFVDLALLSLIFPFDVVTANERNQILENVRYHLEREHGVIRYKNDYYYNKNADGKSEEAEWCFGLSWLALIYAQLGDRDTAKYYMQKSFSTINHKGEIPELYFSNSDEYNNNSPLGWAESMFVVALNQFQTRGYRL